MPSECRIAIIGPHNAMILPHDADPHVAIGKRDGERAACRSFAISVTMVGPSARGSDVTLIAECHQKSVPGKLGDLVMTNTLRLLLAPAELIAWLSTPGSIQNNSDLPQ